MRALLPLWVDNPEFIGIAESLAGRVKQQTVYGLAGSHRAYLLAALRQKLNRPLLVLTADRPQGEKLAADLATFLPGDAIELFPATEIVSFELLAQSFETVSQRLSVLDRLSGGERGIVIAPVKALLTRLVPPDVFRAARIELQVGQAAKLEDLAAALVALGYERTEMVESKGQFSIRGGIADVYPLLSDAPLRVEFFGDEVDSIRQFSAVTQRSEENVRSLAVGPACEMVLTPSVRERGVKNLAAELEQRLKRLRDIKKKNELAAKINGLVEKLNEGAYTENLTQYLPYFYPAAVSFLSYLPADTVIAVDETARVREAAGAAETLVREAFIGALEAGRVLPGQADLYIPYADLLAEGQQRQVLYLSLLLRQLPQTAPERIVSFISRPMYAFGGNFAVLRDELGGLLQKNYRAVICTGSAERGRKLQALLLDNGMPARFTAELTAPPPAGVVTVTTGALEGGFDFPALRLAVITDAEVVVPSKRGRRSRTAGAGGKSLNLLDLKTGDYVVHVNHGIGRFLGVKTLTIDNIQKDYLFIQYSGEDRLYVPVDQIGQVQRYVGAEGHEPRVSKLGGAEWAKAKHSAKAAVEQMADELIALYAARQTLPGIPASPDTVWQKEFEDRFPYTETADQLQSVREIKADMESDRPMDRLLCGDVGYGKTEVALRAAFKAVMDGRQVAVLVPTTILAQQHYNTFRERFAPYPVTIGMLSRFRTAREQKQTVEDVGLGLVDIVIGTHRLLQNDLRFKNLGLLIVDEEQRFGVAHKEKLKRLKQNVDVLTLTATPIPRTLQMSLVGLRDMSSINEPPEDRHPVQTYVMEYDGALVRDAIQRELDRGGQVYFVHNTVQQIDKVARQLQQLVPEARIAVGHGQMREEELEEVMFDFIEGETDVLVCTTIVEAGLDIPNVNTLIVDDADHFGLSQLYQLRGRVGRSNRLAYAYFLYRKDKVLTEIAEKRLQAIKEFTEFGSGFKIAMRDLEIRGAGNLLGAEQSGHLLAVGFEMYCELLEEAVRKAQGKPVETAAEPTIEIKLDAYLPDTYIGDSKQKIALYKRIAAARTEADIDDLADELRDRYGDLPAAADNLLTVARMRVLARTAKIGSITQNRDQVVMKFATVNGIDGEKIWQLALEYRRQMVLTAGKIPSITLRMGGAGRENIVLTVLRRLQNCVSPA